MIAKLSLAAALVTSAPAAHAQDCSEWGTIDPGPDPDALFIEETYRFFVGAGGGACGDIESCSWSLDEANAVGDLLQTTGSPVQYQAPDTLDGCTPVSFQLLLICEGADSDAINMTVQCTAEAKAALLSAPGSTVAGGGCTQPVDLSVVLPGMLIPFWFRRMRSARSEPRRG